LTPNFRVHIQDGGILSTGNTFGLDPILPPSLLGPRFIWYPRKGAFRAGESVSWNDANIGEYSTAFGLNTEASGNYSFAAGNGALAVGHFSTAFNGGMVYGDGGFAINSGTVNVSGGGGFAVNGGEVNGQGGFAFGSNAISNGVRSFAGGSFVSSGNLIDFVWGENAVASGGFSVCFGTASQALGEQSYVFGFQSQTTAIAKGGVSIGYNVQSNAEGAFVLGYSEGAFPVITLQNNISRSLMVGFESDRSTFFVGPSAGAGTTGRVAIGDITTMAGGVPNNKLEINSDASQPTLSGLRFTDLPSTSPTVSNPGLGVLSVDVNGDVIYVPMTAGTDDQNLTGATLVGTNLTIDIENGTSVTVDLATLQDGIGTDDQNLTGATLVGNILTIDIENGASVSVDLSGLITTTGTFGAACSAPVGAGNLLSNTKVGFNNFNVYFQGQGTIGNNAMGIGYNCTDFLVAKLNVQSTGTGTPNGFVTVVTSTNPNNTGGIFRVSAATTSNTGLTTNGTGGVTATGARITGSNSSSINYGVVGSGTGINPASAVSTWAFGGYFKGSYANRTYGIYAEGVPSTVGTTTNIAGYFAGTIVTGPSFVPSDLAFKENITPLADGSDVINQLNPVTYTYKETGNAVYMHFNQGNQVGFIAQEVEVIAPDLVKEITHPAQFDTLGNEIVPEFAYKTLDYEKFVPYLVADAQNKNNTIDSLTEINNIQDSTITNLNNRLTFLENCLSALLPTLCEMNQSMIIQNNIDEQNQIKSTLNITLSSENNIVLQQNVPNPFAEQTVISYSIPPTVKQAQILFYDKNGKLINTVDIAERGLGQLNVYASDLSSGIYTYTLVADGVVVSTKKMMRSYG